MLEYGQRKDAYIECKEGDKERIRMSREEGRDKLTFRICNYKTHYWSPQYVMQSAE
jgi:hypothetical protein